MLDQYHHESCLRKLCQELVEVGREQDAKGAFTSVMASPNDDEQRASMRALVGLVRRIREARRDQTLYVMETAMRLIEFLDEKDSQIASVFSSTSPEEAAEIALKHLLDVTTLEAARGKLHHDFDDGDGGSSEAIQKALNKRAQEAAAKLSVYGARAGGMTLGQYNEQVRNPILRTLDEQAEQLDLPDSVRKHIKEILK